MIVYADRKQRVVTADLLRQIEEAADADERLIRFGQLESGVLDELFPEVDGASPLVSAFSEVALGRKLFEELRSFALPAEISVGVPEGYAFYSLFPDQYRAASRRLFERERPAECVVIGIRSIGTSLSAVVASTLLSAGVRVERFTVRPHGHPFEREIRIDEALMARILRHARTAHFCVVDEGPGISGSSFASVADKLGELGVPDDRIVLFPSHSPDPSSLRSERAQGHWQRHPIYVEAFRRPAHIPDIALDLSGGVWRDLPPWSGRPALELPAVQPQHERTKYLEVDRLWKFSGLAHIGRGRFDRARTLAEAGFSPSPLEFREGFIAFRWIDVADSVEGDLLERTAQYLAFVRRSFPTGEPVRYSELAHMIETNTGLACPSTDLVIEDQEAIALDGRMLPHEWVGGLKTDSLDHHDDHFFPGTQDIAWDLAGAAIECGFDMTSLAERYVALQPDPSLSLRLPFYVRAYLAYRVGYVQMAIDGLPPGDEKQRFQELQRRYSLAWEAATAEPLRSAI